MIHCAFFTYLSLVTGCHQSTKLPEVIKKKREINKILEEKKDLCKKGGFFKKGELILFLIDADSAVCAFLHDGWHTVRKLRKFTGKNTIFGVGIP